MDGIAKMIDTLDMTKVPKHGLLDQMELWLAGEPVWPHAKIVEAWPEFEYWLRRDMRKMADQDVVEFKEPTREEIEAHMNDSLANFRLRDEWVRRYGFAIPCAELLDELAKNKLVVEIGAGTGYMTALMRHRGINAISSDLEKPGQNEYRFEVGKYDPGMITGMTGKAIVKLYPEAAIFCSWPTLNEPWFKHALKAMRIGQTMIVIREEACAERGAWNYFDNWFEQVTTIGLPMFNAMHDHVDVRVKTKDRMPNERTSL